MSVPRIAFPIHALVVGRVEKLFIPPVSNRFHSARHNFQLFFLNDNNALSPEKDGHVSGNEAGKYKYDLGAVRKMVSY
jgi:hypothetical protein